MNKGIIILVLLTGITLGGFGQESIDLRKIRSDFRIGKIIKYERLSNNYAPHVKDLYALYLRDGKVRIYDSNDHKLQPDVLSRFRLGYLSYAAIRDDKWVLYTEDGTNEKPEDYKWIQIGEFDQSEYDSISIIDFAHFIASRDNKKDLLRQGYGEDKVVLTGSVSEPCNILYNYPGAGALIVRLKENKKIVLLSNTTGTPVNDFRADEVINYPDEFMVFSVVRNEGQLAVYSIKDNQKIDDGFTKYYIVDGYNFPLIIKPDYIGLGEYEWSKVDIKDAVAVEFEDMGERVDARVTTKTGKTYLIDCGTGQLKE